MEDGAALTAWKLKCFANNFFTRSGSNCQLFVFNWRSYNWYFVNWTQKVDNLNRTESKSYLQSIIAAATKRSKAISTLTPQGSVASSSAFCITWLIVSRSERISARFLVPRTFRNVVAANSRVEWLQNEMRMAWNCVVQFVAAHKLHQSLTYSPLYCWWPSWGWTLDNRRRRRHSPSPNLWRGPERP
jgi:hypothetical protein